MATQKKSSASKTKSKKRPATSPEAREKQLISLAYDLAEQQLIDGTISASALTQLLKAGSEKTRLENQKLETDNTLNEAKTETLKSAKRVEELYEEMMAAYRSYRGLGADEHGD